MKLVRDKIPELRAAGLLGEHYLGSEHRDSQVFRLAIDSEYRLLLRMKLAEETGEASDPVERRVKVEQGIPPETDYIPYVITVPGLHDKVTVSIDGRN